MVTIDAPPVGPSPDPRLIGTSRRTLLMALRSAVLGTMVSYAINLAILPFVLHQVGADLYGAWATIASVLAIGTLADAGIRTEIVRRVAAANGGEDDAGVARAVHEGLTLLAGVAAVMITLGFVAAPGIRGFAFPNGVPGYDAAGIDWLIRAIVAMLAVSVLGSGYFGVLRGVQRGDIETTARTVGVPIGAAVTIAGVAAGWSLWALFLGSAAQLLVSLGWQWVATVRLLPSVRPRFVRMGLGPAKAYLGLSSLVLLCQLGDVFDFQWDKLMLSHFVGGSAVASYVIGTNLVLQARTLAQLPLLPLLTAASELRERDPARMEALFDLMGKVGMVITSVVLGGVFVFGPSFIRLWLGPEMGDAGRAARLFTVAVALNLVATPLTFRVLAEGWHGLAAVSALVNVIVNGVLSAVLTIAIGFNGPLYGSIAGNLAGTVVGMVLMRRRLGTRFRPPPLRAIVIGVASVATAVTVGFDNADGWIGLVVRAALFGAVVGYACVRAEGLSLATMLNRRLEPVRP